MLDVLVALAGFDEDTGFHPADLGKHWAVRTQRLGDGASALALRTILYFHGDPLGDSASTARSRLVQEAMGLAIPVARDWEIVPLIGTASVVHVCRPFSKAGELATVAGRLLGAKLILSELGEQTSASGRSFGGHMLADVILVGTDWDQDLDAHPQTRQIDFGAKGWQTTLANAYHGARTAY